MTGRAWRWQHTLPLLVIGLVVVVANGPALLGWVDPNPLNLDSGLAAITHPGLLSGLPATDPNAGFTAQALGHLVARDWLGGHVPWWNPFEGLGTPLAGEMESGAFFPPNLLLYFSNGQVYVHALLELIAGLTTYELLTELHLGRLAATSGAILCALCGTFAWFGHAAANPVAFLPMLLWGIERAANRGKGTFIIALALALSIYAGFPETAYIDAVLAAAWTVARVITTPNRRRFVLTVGAGVGGGLLLAAPILVAFADYLPAANLGANAGLYAKLSLTKQATPTLFLPYIYGPIDALNGHDPTGTLSDIWLNAGGYLGLPTVVLGTIGAFSRRHRVLVIALIAWLLLALGRTFGLDGITPLINALPGMTHVQFSRYAQPSMVMAGLALAAIGLDRIGRGRASLWQVLAGTGAGLLVLALSLLEARGLLHRLGRAADHWAWASIGWAAFTVIALTVAALVLRGRARLLTLAALVALDALALFVIPELSAPRGAKEYLGPVTYLEAHLGTSRFFTVGPIAPDYGSYFEISSLAIDDDPVPTGYLAYTGHQLGGPPGPFAPAGTGAAFFLDHLDAFEQADVRYLVTPGDFTLPASGPTLRLVFSAPSGDIFEVPHPTGLYAAPGCQLSDARFDAIRLNCASASNLVRKELSMRGWSATVNGTPTVVTSHGDFEQVHLPRGAATITFTFTPPYTDLAVAAFGLGLLGLLAAALWPKIRVRPRGPRPPDPVGAAASGPRAEMDPVIAVNEGQ